MSGAPLSRYGGAREDVGRTWASDDSFNDVGVYGSFQVLHGHVSVLLRPRWRSSPHGMRTADILATAILCMGNRFYFVGIIKTCVLQSFGKDSIFMIGPLCESLLYTCGSA